MTAISTSSDSSAPRILISRLSHIGDCILTIPVANAIRKAFPDSMIAWAIEAPGDRIIKNCKAIDQVITVPKSWLKKPLKSWKLRSKLRSFRFDISIDPQSLTKSSGIAWMSGAKQRVGLQKPLGRELSTWLNNDLVKVDSRHVVDRSLEMLSAIGISNVKAEFDLEIPAESANVANEIAESCVTGKGFVVMNPGAGWKSRQWCNHRFGQVAKHIAEQHNLTPLITWFGDEEEKMANEIVRSSDGLAIKSPSTKLWELGGLIQLSHFYLGCDTGPTHLAAALKKPCITLFGTTEPEVSGPYEFDLQNPQHIRIQSYYQAGTSRERRKAPNDAMMKIEVNEVNEAVDLMVAKVQRAKAA